MVSKRKKISIGLNFTISLAVLIGVLLSAIFARRDGYSHWGRRLLYFTQQSNIWIGVTCLVFAIASLIEIRRGQPCVKRYVYVLKYVFTVAITITGIIFCCLLAPFADYDVWSTGSVLVHVVVPILSVVDWFFCEAEFSLRKIHIFLTLVPPLLYFIVASILGVAGVDFGRGVTYPYIFMNYNSEEGWFGITNNGIPKVGSAYWLLVVAGMVLFFAWLYYYVKTKQQKAKEK